MRAAKKFFRNDSGKNLFLSEEARKIIFPGPHRLNIPNIYTFRPQPGQQATEIHDRQWFQKQIRKCGHIILKNTGIKQSSDIQKWRQKFVQVPMDHEGGQAHRDQIGSGVLQVSYEPPHIIIPYHNELSYQNKFPTTLAFCCVQPSETGGITGISDNVKVTKNMHPQIVQKMRKYGFHYHLNFQNRLAFQNGRQSRWYNYWQRAFQLESKEELSKILEKQNYKFRWGKNDFLHLEYWNSGFHVSDKHDGFVFHMNSIIQSHGQYFDTVDPYAQLPMSERPFHAKWGNGEELTADEFIKIYKVFKEFEITVPYQAGDIILVDNLQFMHSRTPFQGDRSIGVIMGDPVIRVDPIF